MWKVAVRIGSPAPDIFRRRLTKRTHCQLPVRLSSRPLRSADFGGVSSEQKNVLRSFLRIPIPSCGIRLEIMADWTWGTQGRRSVELFILGQAWIFFLHFTVKKQGSPCLLKGSLAYRFRGLPINMQYVKRVCGKIVSSYRNLCTAGKNGLGNLYNVNFARKKDRFSTKTLHQLSISDEKTLLQGKLRKHI